LIYEKGNTQNHVFVKKLKKSIGTLDGETVQREAMRAPTGALFNRRSNGKNVVSGYAPDVERGDTS